MRHLWWHEGQFFLSLIRGNKTILLPLLTPETGSEVAKENYRLMSVPISQCNFVISIPVFSICIPILKIFNYCNPYHFFEVSSPMLPYTINLHKIVLILYNFQLIKILARF